MESHRFTLSAVPTHLGAVAETATEHWHDLAVDVS